MSGGFGRKGVTAEAPVLRGFGNAPVSAPPRARPAERPATGPADGLSPEARAFIAAERARGAEPQGSTDPVPFSTASTTFRASPKPKPARSIVTAYVLWWFGAILGAHRFYLGAYRSGMALTGLFWGGLALGAVMSKKSSLWIGGYAVPPFWVAMILASLLWSFVDAFLIPGLMRRYRAERQTEGLAHVFA